MSDHKHDLEIRDWQSCIDFDDEEKTVSIFLTCSADGCEYWRKDYYSYDVSELLNGDVVKLEDIS